MKVAMMTYSLKPRGGVVHALSLAEAIAKKGVNVELFALRRSDQKDQYPAFYRHTDLPFKIFDFDWHEEIRTRLRSMVAAYVDNLPNDCEIYHAQDCVCDTALQLLSSEGRIKAPLVRTIHHVEGFSDEYLDNCEQTAIHADTEKITVSKFWHDELLKRYGIESTTIHNGIDLEKYKYKIREREPFILFVGGLEARKGLEFAIESMEILQKRGRNLRLIAIARPGFRALESKAWFDHLIERCKLTDKIEILDMVPEKKLIDLYSRASVFLLTSRMEGWGLSIMEAMASGCPVVATSVGGVCELIQTEKNGILVEQNDVLGFADAIEKVLDKKSLRNKIISNARKDLEQYSWDISAEKTIGLYDRIIEKRKKSLLREIYVKYASFAKLTLHPNLSLMRFDHAFCQGKA